MSLSELTSLQKDPEWMEDETKRNLVLQAINKIDGSSIEDLFKVTPYVLRLTDHYTVPARLTGLECISLLVLKFSVDDLKNANFDGLFFATLKSLLYHDDVQLIAALVPTLLKFIERLQYGAIEIEQVYATVIKTTRLTSNVELKAIFMHHVLHIAGLLKNRLRKFVESLLDLASENLQDDVNQNTYKVMSITCDLLLIIIKVVKNQSKVFLHQVIVILLKLYIKLCDFNHEAPFPIAELSLKVEAVMQALSVANPELMESMKRECYDKLREYSKDYLIIEKVFNKFEQK